MQFYGAKLKLATLRSLGFVVGFGVYSHFTANGQANALKPARVVTNYALTSASSREYPDPANWRLLGSHDGGSWVVLDIRTNEVFKTRSLRRVFSITNDTAFEIYRLEVGGRANRTNQMDSWQRNGAGVQLAELELMGPVVGVSNETELHATYHASKENPLIGPATDAFDGDPMTRWVDYGAGNQCWLQCEYGRKSDILVTNISQLLLLGRRMAARNPLLDKAPQILSNLTSQTSSIIRPLSGYALTSANDVPDRDPRDWRLLGSNDRGQSWVTLDARRNESFTTRFQRRVFALTNVAAFAVYRLQIDSVRVPTGVSGGANSVQIAEIEPIYASTDKAGRYSMIVSAQGENPPLELAEAAFDSDAKTKWLDFAAKPESDGNGPNTNKSSWIQWLYIPGAERPVINFHWLSSVHARPAQTMRASVEGVVVARDLEQNSLILLDETGFQSLRLDIPVATVQPGERVRLSGQIQFGQDAHSLFGAGVVSLGLLPRAAAISSEEPLRDDQQFQAGTVEGIVTSISAEPARLDICLIPTNGGGRLLVKVFNSKRQPAPFSLGSRLKVEGIVQPIFNEHGQRVPGIIWVPDLSWVSVQPPAVVASLSPSLPATNAVALDAEGKVTQIKQVRQWLEQGSGKGLPVKLRGVITYIDLGLGSFYLQDGPDGILVNGQLGAGLAPFLQQEGLYVELEGRTSQSPPGIDPISFVKVLGRGRMPKPIHPSWEQLMSGRDAGRWIELEGVVREAEVHRLVLVANGGHLVVWINEIDRDALNRLPGNTVKISGVCGVVANSRNVKLGVRLLVPSFEHVQVLKAVPDNPFAIPLQPIRAVMELGVNPALQNGPAIQLLKTSGVVTHYEPRILFIQEGSDGLRVFTRTDASVQPGDRVEVVGFAEPDGFSPKLVQAFVRKTGQGPLPQANPLDIMDAQLSNQDATRGQIEAVVVGSSTRDSLQILELQELKRERTFSAFMPTNNGALADIPIGSRIRLQGVFKAATDTLPDFGQVITSFQMYLNSPEDVTVLERPPWWTARHTLWLLAGAAGAMVLSLGSVALLRRQVRQRTRELHDQVAERLRAEEALRDSAALYHSLVESLPQNILRKDLEGRFTFANAFFCRTMGKSMEEIIGKTDYDLFSSDLAQKFRADDQLVIASGKLFQTVEDNRNAAGERIYVEVIKTPLHDSEKRLVGLQIIFWDVTPRKQAEEKLAQAHRQLLETSRRAGMAEVATSVLHNVGNVLNSVNVSASLVADTLKKSKISSLGKVVTLMGEHESDLENFLLRDPKGKHIPAYLAQLASHLAIEQGTAISELEELTKHIEHIKDIVTMQQGYAKVSGVVETLPASELVEDALRMNSISLVCHDVRIVRQYDRQLPEITVEKHKVLQILVNLVRNANYACDESGRPDKRMIVRVRNGDGRVKIDVIDNGIGIKPENLTSIFSHGFTTRKDGHGFGLHSGALAARDLGGMLSVHSDGPGQGASFTLELPVKPKEGRL